MKLLKKTLHLNYSEPKGDKQVVKSYSFNVNADTDDTKLKEVGDEIAKLVSKNIDNTTINTKSLIYIEENYYGKNIKYFFYNYK